MKAPGPLLLLAAAIALAPAADLVGAPLPSAAGGAVSPLPFDLETGPADPEPWISERIPPRLSRRLGAAFALAAARIREHPRCQALFADLGREGLETMLASQYHSATMVDERDRCRGTAALTSVGGRRIRLCRTFWRLTTTDAAVILIHEALHHAGLGEYPSDPQGMTSPEISWLVKERCAL